MMISKILLVHDYNKFIETGDIFSSNEGSEPFMKIGLGSRAAIIAGAVGTMTGASIGYESYKGLGVPDPEDFMKNKLLNGTSK